MSVVISAVVCTHNRAAYLRRALESLVTQTLSAELYEIIVVDNASTDGTRQVVGEFADMPNLRYLYEQTIGLSTARNTGWRNARGDVVAYLDDDAVACAGWLGKFLDGFREFEPRPGAIGGRCDPIWESPRPDWLSDKMLGYLAIVDWSETPIIVGYGQWLAGCNIAYPREVLQAVGGFREDLGRQGRRTRSSEETFLGAQLAALGQVSVYAPDIVVRHHVSPARLSKEWFRRTAFWQGMSDAIMVRPTAKQLPFRVRMGQSFRKIGWSLPRSLLMVVGTNAAARFRRQCQVFEAIGYVSGLWRREVERE